MLHARRRAVRSAFLASLGNPGFHAITQDIAREFREHCKHASECASGLGIETDLEDGCIGGPFRYG